MKDIQESPPEDQFEVEVSALEPEGEEHAPPVGHPPLGLSRPARAKRVLLVAGALLALLLVLVSVPSLRNQALGLGGGFPVPTARVVNSTPITAPPPQPGRGWLASGPRYSSAIAFATNMPTTAYTCGVRHPDNGQSAPLIIGVTHNAGLIWQTLSTPATGVTCNLTVNPTNALDVLMVATPGNQCSSERPSRLYRTFDGGMHWSAWSLPSAGPIQSTALFCYQWAWVGATLYFSPILSGDIDYNRLAVSVAGQAFAWVQPADFLTGAPTYASISALFATSAALYIELASQSCLPTCYWFSRKTNAGWSRFAPTAQGQAVGLLGTGPDAQTLLGEIVNEPPPDKLNYLISTDGGTTWRDLAPRPDLLVAGAIAAVPDGTVFAAFAQDPDSPTGEQGTSAVLGIYELAPGSSAWQYVADVPPAEQFVVAWSIGGHPTALWAQIDPIALSAGLERHQLVS